MKGVPIDWTELLKSEIEFAYRGTEGLLDLVDEDSLDWKHDTISFSD